MTTRIDSASNPRIVAALKAVASHEKMLLEGTRMIEEALEGGVSIEEVFASDISRMIDVKGLRPLRGARSAPLTSDTRGENFLLSGLHQQPRISERTLPGRLHQQPPHIRRHLVTEVSPRVLRKLSDLPSTRGVIAIAAPPQHDLASLSALLPSKKSSSSTSLFLLLDDVQDPANVGAILRSAEAFGVAAALLTPGCAWPFSPRVLRASAGSAFRLPVAARVTSAEAVAWASRHGIALAGAAAHGGAAPEALIVRPLALVIGSEGHGISAEIAGALDHRVTLPLAGRVDSLNAAVAAGVLLHILSRPPESAR